MPDFVLKNGGMKYSININQLVLADTNLDLLDAAILEYIYYYCTSQNEKIIANRVCEGTVCWTWVDYRNLIEDMPILRIKSIGSLTPRIERIKEAGFVKNKRIGNQKLYFSITGKCDELFIKQNRAIHETKQLKGKSYSVSRTYSNTSDSGITDKPAAAKAAGAGKVERKNPIDDQTPMNLKQFVEWTSKPYPDGRPAQRHIQIIGMYADEKNINYTTKGQWVSLINRYSRAARRLSPFTDDQLGEAMSKLKKAEQEYLRKWTLETLESYLEPDK